MTQFIENLFGRVREVASADQALAGPHDDSKVDCGVLETKADPLKVAGCRELPKLAVAFASHDTWMGRAIHVEK